MGVGLRRLMVRINCGPDPSGLSASLAAKEGGRKVSVRRICRGIGTLRGPIRPSCLRPLGEPLKAEDWGP